MRTRFFARRAPSPAPRLASACYAPHSALYFEPNGTIQACCATGFNLGRVSGPGRRSLREIWDGANIAAQRAALERGSYEYACQECEIGEAAGGREATTASHFDRYADGAPHPFPLMMDFALSNRCNLQCVMCNGGLSSTIRAQREGLPPLPPGYDDRFFTELEEFLPHLVRAQFKGGEPFLARENRRIWDFFLAHGLRPEVTVTTNGTIYNANVERYVRELGMHTILSIDGMQAETLESIRVGVHAPTIWRNVDRFQALGEETGAGTTLSFCVMADNWRETLPFLLEADRRGVNGNVIFVNQPHRHDLLRLPHHELEAVLAELDPLPATFRSDLVARNWQEVLDRVRSQIEHPVELVLRATPVAAPSRATSPAADLLATGEVAALRERLGSAYGCEPLDLRFDGDVVAEVHVPPWADDLGAGSWPGRDLEGLQDALEVQVGPVAPGWLPSEDPRVTSWVLALAATDHHHRDLHVHRFAEAAGPERALLYRAPR